MQLRKITSWTRGAAWLTAVAIVITGGLWACSGGDDAGEEHSLVPPGKADDFFSTTAQEFLATGISTVTIEESWASATDEEKLARATELADAKTAIIATYLNYLVVDKSSHSTNPDYGGYHAMARPASFDQSSVSLREGLTYEFTFAGEIGADKDFFDLIPEVPDATVVVPDGSRVLRLPIPRMTAAHIEGSWKYQSGWSPSSFDPAGFAPETLENLDLVTTPIDNAADAWLDYRSLLADGKLEIGIHFGYDYNEQRYDISEAEHVFNRLKAWGYSMPVESFDDLQVDSDLFVKRVRADGREITVEIKLVHAGMVDPVAQGAVLKASLVESLEKREVILFNGHAGYSGRLLPGNWQLSSSGVIPPEEIAELALPATYQIVMVNGCDTYAIFADNFRANPAKRDAADHLAHIDILTTTSFSWLSQMGDVCEDVLKAVAGGADDRITPYTWDKLLTNINDWTNRDVFFGVHGIDTDPRLHPYANEEKLCDACTSDADCGGEGNLCVKLLDGRRACTPTCLDDSGCPAGTACQKVATGYTINTKQCVPAAGTCGGEPPATTARVIINEVLADPPPNELGDANGDGNRDFTEDEFVELVNTSGEIVDLSGWTIADGYDVRFVFPDGTLLGPGEACVVFGGGNPADFRLAAAVPAFAASQGLGLTNTGDSVYLSDRDGNPVDAVTYGAEGGEDRSVTRAEDGNPQTSLIPHPGTACSPGTRQDGSPF